MGLFVMGNLLAWQAPSYETLILARILTGLAHGVFFSIGSMILHTTSQTEVVCKSDQMIKRKTLHPFLVALMVYQNERVQCRSEEHTSELQSR